MVRMDKEPATMACPTRVTEEGMISSAAAVSWNASSAIDRRPSGNRMEVKWV